MHINHRNVNVPLLIQDDKSDKRKTKTKYSENKSCAHENTRSRLEIVELSKVCVDRCTSAGNEDSAEETQHRENPERFDETWHDRDDEGDEKCWHDDFPSSPCIRQKSPQMRGRDYSRKRDRTQQSFVFCRQIQIALGDRQNERNPESFQQNRCQNCATQNHQKVIELPETGSSQSFLEVHFATFFTGNFHWCGNFCNWLHFFYRWTFYRWI